MAEPEKGLVNLGYGQAILAAVEIELSLLAVVVGVAFALGFISGIWFRSSSGG